MNFKKHWRNCIICGNKIFEKYRITCSEKCSKKYVMEQHILKFNNLYKIKRKEIKSKEKNIKKLEKHIYKKFKINIPIPYDKNKHWPKCKKCKTICYIYRKYSYCEKCDIITDTKFLRWGKSKKGDYYNKCIKCHKTKYKHQGFGYCKRCYNKFYMKGYRHE